MISTLSSSAAKSRSGFNGYSNACSSCSNGGSGGLYSSWLYASATVLHAAHIRVTQAINNGMQSVCRPPQRTHESPVAALEPLREMINQHSVTHTHDTQVSRPALSSLATALSHLRLTKWLHALVFHPLQGTTVVGQQSFEAARVRRHLPCLKQVQQLVVVVLQLAQGRGDTGGTAAAQ